MIEKYESRRIRVDIRHVLLEVWDPIGINAEPNAQDEYDDYIERIYELLVNHAPDCELIDYLYWAVHENMGLLGATRANMNATVEGLRRISLRP